MLYAHNGNVKSPMNLYIEMVNADFLKKLVQICTLRVCAVRVPPQRNISSLHTLRMFFSGI